MKKKKVKTSAKILLHPMRDHRPKAEILYSLLKERIELFADDLTYYEVLGVLEAVKLDINEAAQRENDEDGY